MNNLNYFQDLVGKTVYHPVWVDLSIKTCSKCKGKKSFDWVDEGYGVDIHRFTECKECNGTGEIGYNHMGWTLGSFKIDHIKLTGNFMYCAKGPAMSFLDKIYVDYEDIYTDKQVCIEAIKKANSIKAPRSFKDLVK